MINNFIIAENKGREKFKEVVKQNPLIYDLNFTEDAYNNVDAYFWFKGKKYAVEIKDRYSYYSEWSIEILKYEKLKELIEKGDIKSGYFAIFYKDTCYLYDFNIIEECYKEFGIGTMYARKTTMGNSDYTIKKVITLPTSKAKIIKL